MVERLSAERFEAARAFIEREGRPLEVALLRQGMGVGGAEAVLEALAAFQNPDGGFGHGLETDMTSPASTAIATSIGLRLLIRVGAPAGHPMVAGALRWLDDNLDRELGVWWIVGPGVELAQHAPWWGWSVDMIGSDSIAGAKLGFGFNPTAELLGQLYHYGSPTTSAVTVIAERRMRQTVAETPVIESAYDLKCAIRLAETPQTPADLRGALTTLVRGSTAAHDPNDEHAPVLELATRPDSLVADLVADRVDGAVADLIAGQQPDGGWTTFWDWSFVDAAAWAKAQRDARGWITRETIETLRAWGRVEKR